METETKWTPKPYHTMPILYPVAAAPDPNSAKECQILDINGVWIGQCDVSHAATIVSAINAACDVARKIVTRASLNTLKTGHTPGPWTLEKMTDGDWAIYEPEDRECGRIALIEDDSVNEPTEGVAANARLIAAAPELLAACKGLVEMYSDAAPYGQSPVVEAARAAIARAEGMDA